ncbi:FlaG/FlaF family flagellin (archaellin) [Methanomicrobium sp. W14]|uniref:type IV pilin N-terminal domain-containing protein n=1 Tax=Methanomicrobium sp. W14 TaxID=2817839 RepID=UPI001AEA4A83|nr:type IV pilin N-terminal domain-containing protein [Methanomicrobium sp. W14]MBP2133478.1 FlaG/FlaF family flagellin (archaellin) [Methanomicrobium sp. W14]
MNLVDARLKRKKNDMHCRSVGCMLNYSSEAVSPVIGVMLMLVVTIIVAAAVSAYAGGFASNQEQTPTAQLDVQLKPGDDAPRFVITHLGGDPLDTSDLKIITYYHKITRPGKAASEEVFKHTTDGSLNPSVAANYFDSVDYSAGTGSSVSNNGYPCTVSNGDPVKYWGNSTMMPGDVYTTTDATSLESVTTSKDIGDEPIEVEVIYIPSGGTIYSGEVIA